MITSPGFYQILGEHATGKTLLATLLSRDKRVAWVVTAQEHSPGLWRTLDYQPDALIMIETVSAAFDALQMLQSSVDMLVLDSLASLLTRTSIISTDITTNFFMPRVPILVINQERYPKPPGGYKWHNAVITINLNLIRRRPALYTKIGLTNYWLIWWLDVGPQIRKLEIEDYCWLPKGKVCKMSDKEKKRELQRGLEFHERRARQLEEDARGHRQAATRLGVRLLRMELGDESISISVKGAAK